MAGSNFAKSSSLLAFFAFNASSFALAASRATIRAWLWLNATEALSATIATSSAP